MSAPPAAPGESAASELQRRCRELLAGLEPVGAGRRYAAPGREDWSAIQVLAHAVEFVPYWTEQAAAVAARTDAGDQSFGRTHDDPARIAAVREHALDRYETLATQLTDTASRCASTLRSIPAASWSRTAVHARRGSLTVDQIVRQFLLDHLEEHRAQAEAAVSRTEGQPRPS